ncbi:MAG: enoyl-CoA hydratase/isomerase family protein [Chloroflexi bacterium]|nr:enoyl-CoA hydratase/isomerase family protein [Chloroflexota bacterium]
MQLQTVLYSAEGGVARIVMNRPEKRNALNHQLLDDIDAAFTAAEMDDSVRVVVLSANGPSFSAGYDLKGSYYTSPPEKDGRWTVANSLMALRGMEARYQRIWNCPKPTIARVHGHAVAGGCYLQLLCDISVAADDAILGHPAVKMGGVSSMPLWQVALGLKKARYLLLTGRLVDGREAERIGLVTLSVPPEQLDATVEGVIADCLEVPFEGALQNKEALNTSLEIMGVGALFRYHGQMNALGRLRERRGEGDGFERFR